MSQTVHFGFGSVAALGEELRRRAARRVLLVTGRDSFTRSGAEDSVAAALKPVEAVRFADFASNPELEDARRGVALFRDFRPDVVLAVGGGTAMDMAKLVAGLGAQHGEPEAAATGREPLQHPACRLIAIPTTAGSGSEATHFAVVYHRKVKYSLAHASLLPAVALLDPELTLSLPPALTAATGVDALCQAVESCWAVGSTDESRGWARQAIAMVLEHLPAAVHRPTREARAAMLRAAHLAGRAINVTKTTAPHALSYPMTAHYGIRHGQAVALTLPLFFVFNAAVTESDAADPRGAAHVRSVMDGLVRAFGSRTPAEAAARIRALMREVGLATTLAEAGVATNGARQVLLDGVNEERLANNPRRISREQLASLLAQA